MQRELSDPANQVAVAQAVMRSLGTNGKLL